MEALRWRALWIASISSLNKACCNSKILFSGWISTPLSKRLDKGFCRTSSIDEVKDKWGYRAVSPHSTVDDESWPWALILDLWCDGTTLWGRTRTSEIFHFSASIAVVQTYHQSRRLRECVRARWPLDFGRYSDALSPVVGVKIWPMQPQPAQNPTCFSRDCPSCVLYNLRKMTDESICDAQNWNDRSDLDREVYNTPWLWIHFGVKVQNDYVT